MMLARRRATSATMSLFKWRRLGERVVNELVAVWMLLASSVMRGVMVASLAPPLFTRLAKTQILETMVAQ